MLHSYHNHTYRCNHAGGEEREYIEKAISAGIRTLGFADHVPQPFEGEYYSHFRMKPHELENYFYTLESLRDEYKNDIKIRIGFEAEYYPELFENMLGLIGEYPCEYLILGQHALGNEFNEHYCSRITDDDSILTRYVDQVSEGLETGRFLYLAHPDILNYDGDEGFYEREMRRLCELARLKDIPLEINVLGIREHRNYPCERFWRIAADVGCTVLLGADAHMPKHVYDKKNIEKAEQLAQRLGLNIITSLEDRFGD